MAQIAFRDKLFAGVLCTILFCTSCSTSGPSRIFGKKSPHEAYGDKIKNAGLAETALGKQWFAAAKQSLRAPLRVSVPYSETGYFAAEKPQAVGVVFNGKQGEKLSINLTKKPETGFAIYLDLWEPRMSGDTTPKFLVAGDTLTSTITYEVEKDGSYILRLQPELLKGGEYTLSINSGPSLAFPVTSKVKSNIGSYWGAGRDAGARRHEGIDIFAPRRTALVAAADGVVTRVNENALGGKVVFLRPEGKNYSLYYAHLDEQLVQPGQTVAVGDTIGLMGNTGNAKTTSPHLHFGIYTNSGAVDPLPFVNKETRRPDKISAPVSYLNKWVRNNKAVKLLSEPSPKATALQQLDANTLLKVEAATASWFKVTLPTGESGFIASNALSQANNAIRKASVKSPQPLFDAPDIFAARKTVVSPGQPVNVIASYKDFYFVDHNNTEGWLPKKSL